MGSEMCIRDSAQSYQDAVRNAVSLGGDSDTLACIAGGIAEAFYGGIPDPIRAEAQARLPPDLWAVVVAFQQRHAGMGGNAGPGAARR